jgi:bacterioferritin-associated ferredoxin
MMIVCHCNYITDGDVAAAVVEMLDQDPWQLIVPGKVYRTLEKRGKCCSCFPNVVEIIVNTVKDYHERRRSEPDEALKLVSRLRSMGDTYRQSLGIPSRAS